MGRYSSHKTQKIRLIFHVEKKCTGLNGENRDYFLYPQAIPPQEPSDYIQEVLFDAYRYHSGEGDMWPITWGADDCLYCGAGRQ